MEPGVTPPLQRTKENRRFCHNLRDPELKPVRMLEEEALPLWLFICFCLGESAWGCWSSKGLQQNACYFPVKEKYQAHFFVHCDCCLERKTLCWDALQCNQQKNRLEYGVYQLTMLGSAEAASFREGLIFLLSRVCATADSLWGPKLANTPHPPQGHLLSHSHSAGETAPLSLYSHQGPP